MKKNFSTILKRVILSGFTNFYRNKTVSISAIAILTTTLMIIGIFFFLKGIFDYTHKEIKNKIDIKIYYKKDASDSDIENIRDKIVSLPQVKSVQFTSADKALEDFKSKHISDSITLQAIEEVGKNPFGASLSIVAHNITDYEIIANSLNNNSTFLGDANNAIEKINYFDFKSSIEKLNNVIIFINTLGLWIIILFAIISGMIIYNTIRLAIFVFRDEIIVMQLVGASNMFIRGPFLIESIIYGIISSIISMILFLPLTYYFSIKTTTFFSGLNIYNYYISNFFQLFGLLLLISITLSLISTFLSIRKYLKV